MIKIRKGLNIPLSGIADAKKIASVVCDEVALVPDQFKGLLLKLLVQEGASVKAGSPIFQDKKNEHIKVVSPVAGVVTIIERGDKRKLLAVKIKVEKQHAAIQSVIPSLDQLDRMAVIKLMLDAGLWPLIQQRPYAIVANPEKMPKSIFVSAFDSAPLAPDTSIVLQGKENEFALGLKILSKLTKGILHLNLSSERSNPPCLTDAKNVKINYFSGPHPAGNVGVQIHHLDPINKGDVVWYTNPQDVVNIGHFFLTGEYSANKIIALTGPNVKEPHYLKVVAGCALSPLLQNKLHEGENRVISGNVLTGSRASEHGYLGFYDQQITVIDEVTSPEFFGWAWPGIGKYSVGRAFLSALFSKKTFSFNTGTHGGVRPFVMNGEYEKVLPMTIMPVQLLKAIIIKDIDLMEQLGIYEVAEEDFALCEFVCTSKINSQQIIRDGLDLLKNELGE